MKDLLHAKPYLKVLSFFFRFSFFFKNANSTSISEAHCEIGCRERMKCYDVVLIKFNWLHGSKRSRLWDALQVALCLARLQLMTPTVYNKPFHELLQIVTKWFFDCDENARCAINEKARTLDLPYVHRKCRSVFIWQAMKQYK